MGELISPPENEISITTQPEGGVEPSLTESTNPDLTNPTVYWQEYESTINFPAFVLSRATQSKEPLTPDEVQDLANTLRTTKVYKDGLWAWEKAHPLPYNRDNYPPEVRISLAKYWEEVIKIRNHEGHWDADEIKHHDFERSFLHTASANEMVSAGLAPNTTVGRLLIHFMSIEKGLDTEDPGRDERRVQGFM